MEPPVPPDDLDCCNSGCNPCILDVYEIQLKRYKEICKTRARCEPELEVNALSPIAYTAFTLVAREQIAPTVFLFCFKYSGSNKVAPNCVRFKAGQYFLLKWKDCEGEFTRAYTPLPLAGPSLSFTVLVRVYDIGRMSKFFKKLQIGHKSFWRGPYGKFVIDYTYKYFFFVAQGTGLAPIFAVVKEIVDNENCESFIKLVYCCRDADDILLRDELYELSSYWNFSYEIFLSQSTTIVRKYNEIIYESKLHSDHLQDYINGKSGQLQAILCGSESFCKSIKEGIKSSGVESCHIHVF